MIVGGGHEQVEESSQVLALSESYVVEVKCVGYLTLDRRLSQGI